MQRQEAYPSGWIKASTHLLDAGGKPGTPMVLTITAVDGHKFNDGRYQRVLRFHERSERLGLNQGNWDAIAGFTGKGDDERWVGERIELFAVWGRGPNGPCWVVNIRQPHGPTAPPVSVPAPSGNPAPTNPAAAPVPSRLTANLQSVDTRSGNVDGRVCTVYGVNTDQGRFGCVDDTLGQQLVQLSAHRALVTLGFVEDRRGRRIVAVEPAADAFAGAQAQDDIAF